MEENGKKNFERHVFLRMNLKYFDNVNPVNSRVCWILTVTDMILTERMMMMMMMTTTIMTS